MIFVFSYQREEMLKQVLTDIQGEDFVVLDDGSDFECENMIKFKHEGKQGFWKKWVKAFEIAKKKEELMTVQDWIKIAQQTFNKYINRRDKGHPCISCGKTITGRVNASHYFNANNHWAVRFDEDNVHSSCITCNQYLSGNLIEYGQRLIVKIGQEKYDRLCTEAKKTRKYSIDELKNIVTLYKQKLKEL